MTYYTDSPRNGTPLISADDNRLLIPQPMPGLDIDKLPPPLKNGAADYLLVSKSVIAPSGEECDSAGVSYEGFSKQIDRCNVVKNSCLKNQPLDLWETDDEKRKAKKKGKYLLENYGTPYKDPIMIDKEAKEHWLALEYYDKQQTVVTIEFNADKIVALTPGKHAQISHVVTASFEKKIIFFVTISNKDLAPASFSVQANECGFGVPDSNNATAIVPPQRRKLFEVETQPGKVELSDKFPCSVVVKNTEYGIVAKRKVLIKPLDRCICNMHCQCVCLGESIKCKPMLQEDYHASGFRGSLPVLTAKPHRRAWIIHHPFLAIFAFLLVLLLLGFAKGIFGLMGFDAIRNLGLKSRIFGRKQIQSYIEPELRNLDVMYDVEGYPINPDTKQRARVLTDEIIFSMNVLFFCIWPCLRAVDSIGENEPPEPPPVDYPDYDAEAYDLYDDFSDDDSEFDDFDDDNEKGSLHSVDLKWDSTGGREELSGQSPHTYDTGQPTLGTVQPTYENVQPTYENVQPTKVTGTRDEPKTGGRGSRVRLRPSVSDSILPATPSEHEPGPPPPNKELARWQKGTARIHAFRT